MDCCKNCVQNIFNADFPTKKSWKGSYYIYEGILILEHKLIKIVSNIHNLSI